MLLQPTIIVCSYCCSAMPPPRLESAILAAPVVEEDLAGEQVTGGTGTCLLQVRLRGPPPPWWAVYVTVQFSMRARLPRAGPSILEPRPEAHPSSPLRCGDCRLRAVPRPPPLALAVAQWPAPSARSTTESLRPHAPTARCPSGGVACSNLRKSATPSRELYSSRPPPPPAPVPLASIDLTVWKCVPLLFNWPSPRRYRWYSCSAMPPPGLESAILAAACRFSKPLSGTHRVHLLSSSQLPEETILSNDFIVHAMGSSIQDVD